MSFDPCRRLAVVATDELTELIAKAVRRESDQKPLSPPHPKEILSNDEIQCLLGVSRATLQRYRSSGQLRYSKVGRKLFYRRSDVVEFVESNGGVKNDKA